MPTINQLTAVDQVVSSDQVPIYSSENGDARKASMATLLAFFSGQITANDDKITQYAAPSATGFSVTINNDTESVWLVLTPTAGFAAGTLILPALANCADRQEILVNCTQAVTTLTINGNGSTVTGAPTTLAVNSYFRLRFDDVTNTWYRVG
jgi:hypothetical protein